MTNLRACVILLTGVLGSLAASAQSSDGDISATTTAPAVLPGEGFAKLEVRHYSLMLLDDDGEKTSAPSRLELRPIFGMRFYDKWLEARLTYGMIKRPATDQVEQRRAELELKLNVLRRGFGTTQPFVKAYLPHAGSGTDADVGIRQLGTLPLVALESGKLELLYEAEQSGGMSSRDQDATIHNYSERPAAEFGLVGEEQDGDIEEPGFKRHLTYRGMYLAGAAFTPARLPPLRVALSTAMRPTHTPKYELHRNGSIYSAYEVRKLMETKFEAIYKLAPQVTLLNELYYYAEGLFERPRAAATRDGKPRWENVLRLDYALL